MSFGFSITGASDGTEQADQAGRGGVAAAIFSVVAQWTLGAAVLPARRSERELVPAMAVDAEGFGA